MGIFRRNTLKSTGTREFVTGDLPFHHNDVVLHFNSQGDMVIQKFRKEQPMIYTGCEALLEDQDYLKADNVLIREEGTGYLPVLLALANPQQKFVVSTWKNNTEHVGRNVEENYLDRRIGIKVERTVVGKTNIGILVHENAQNQDVIREEIESILACSSSHIAFLVSHKKKGGELLAQKCAESLGISCEIIARGTGGSRVFKFRGTPQKRISQGYGYTYKVLGKPVQIKTGGSLFSKEQIDVGTNMLIQYVLRNFKNPESVFDLGCGCGVIGISAAVAWPKTKVMMSDVDTRAISMATENVKNLGLTNQITVVNTDGPEEVKGEFDLILSNPPLHINKKRLLEIIVRARKKLKKKGTMLLVVEDSRVEELRELLYPIIGFIKIKEKGGTHFILGITK